MAASGKVHGVSTKYFICINQRYYVIYFQNIKFVRLLLWPGGVYPYDTYATKPESRSHIRINFMNHDYIGSFWQCQMSQKLHKTTHILNAVKYTDNWDIILLKDVQYLLCNLIFCTLFCQLFP